MRMRHSIGSKQLVIRSKILSPPRGTWNEFASSNWQPPGLAKGNLQRNLPGIDKPLPSTMKKTQAPPKENTCSYRWVTGATINWYTCCSSSMITTIFWATCMGNNVHAAQLINTSLADTSNLDSVSGTNMISSDATDIACNALISVPKNDGSYTPKPPLWPGSVLDQSLSWSVPLTLPPEQSCYAPGHCSNAILQFFQDN